MYLSQWFLIYLQICAVIITVTSFLGLLWYNRLQQTRKLKGREIYSFIILDIRSLKWMLIGPSPLETLGEILIQIRILDIGTSTYLFRATIQPTATTVYFQNIFLTPKRNPYQFSPPVLYSMATTNLYSVFVGLPILGISYK